MLGSRSSVHTVSFYPSCSSVDFSDLTGFELPPLNTQDEIRLLSVLLVRKQE